MLGTSLYTMGLNEGIGAGFFAGFEGSGFGTDIHESGGSLGGFNARVGARYRKTSTTLGGFDKKPQKSTYFALNQAVLGQNQGVLGQKTEIQPERFARTGEKWRTCGKRYSLFAETKFNGNRQDSPQPSLGSLYPADVGHFIYRNLRLHVNIHPRIHQCTLKYSAVGV